MPQAMNGPFLESLNNSLVVPELSQFNVEINGSPTTLKGRAFSRLADELEFTWARCREFSATRWNRASARARRSSNQIKGYHKS